MSDSSVTKQNTIETKRGFSAEDVNAFMQMGNTQGGGGIGAVQFGNMTLQQQTQAEVITKTYDKSGVPGFKKVTPTGKSTETIGFQGQFSDATPDQITALVKVFQNRREIIQNRERAPGRTQLFLVGG